MKDTALNKVLYTIIVCLSFSYLLRIGIEVGANFFNELAFLLNGGWFYGILMIFLLYRSLKRINITWKIDITRLIVLQVILAACVYTLVFKLNFDPIWNVHRPLYRFTLIDDKQYYESDYEDTDPLFGSNNSGTSYSIKYFLPNGKGYKEIDLDEGKIIRDDNGNYSFISKYDEELYINISNSIFWQRAYAIGYLPANKDSTYDVPNFILRLLKIGPYYLFEALIINFGISLLYCLFVLLTFVVTRKSIISYNDHFTKGLNAFEHKDFYEAKRCFDEAINACSNEPEYFYHRGLSKISLKDHQEAIADFDQAIELSANNPEYFFQRGKAKFYLENWEEAIKDLNKAIESNPEYADSYFFRASSKYRLNEFYGSIEDNNYAIKLNPSSASTYYNRGLGKFYIKDYAGAIEDFEKAISINSKDYNYYTMSSKARMKLLDIERAHEDIDHAIKLAPDNIELKSLKNSFYTLTNSPETLWQSLRKMNDQDQIKWFSVNEDIFKKGKPIYLEKVEIVLQSNRVVTVESLFMHRTYWCLLGGYTDSIHTNKNVYGNLKPPTEWGSVKTFEIKPPLTDFQKGLKSFCFFVLLQSTEPLNKEYDGSTLAVMWIDNFKKDEPLFDYIESKIKNIKWDSYAGDFNY